MVVAAKPCLLAISPASMHARQVKRTLPAAPAAAATAPGPTNPALPHDRQRPSALYTYPTGIMALSAFGSGLLQGGLLRVASSSPCGVLGLALLHARGAVQQWACSSRAAAPAGPAAAAVWLQQAAPLSTAAAAGWEEAPFRVSDLIDAHSGPWGSPEQQASPLQVLRPGLR